MGGRRPKDETAELVSQLDTLRLGQAESLGTLTEQLSLLWGAQAISYRPQLAGARWDYEFAHAAGPLGSPRFRATFRDYLAGAPVNFALYNPLRPQADQRNAVWGDREMPPPAEGARTLHVVRHLYTRIGVFGLSQLRVLVCDGPVLLGWIGGFREQPFGARERTHLKELIAPLQRRLRVERLLRDHGATSAGLVAALDEIASPALLVTERASIEHANAAALMLIERDGLSLLDRVAAALRAPPADGSITVTPIASAGMARHSLVVLRGEAANVQLRLALFAERWKLTPKQKEVLLLLVRGEPNKIIADKLDLALVTVESHVTALMRKAKVENRATLVARFWTGL